MKSLLSELLPHRESILRDLVIASLALLSAVLIVLELTLELAAEQTRFIYFVDFLIALIFLADFGYELAQAKHKGKYFRKNWYLLLASIPVSGPVFQSLRSIQLLRLIRVVRLYARIKALSQQSERVSRHSSRYIFVALFATIIIFTGAAGFYQFEQIANPGIDSYLDALWWAVVTATSVGYGDIYPVTIEGRMVASVLMLFGLALIGTIVGIVSNYFLVTEAELIDKNQ